MILKNFAKFVFSVRFMIAIVAFFGYCIQYMQKVSMSIGILAMVNHTALSMLSAGEIRSRRVADNFTAFDNSSSAVTLEPSLGNASWADNNASSIFRQWDDQRTTIGRGDDQCPEMESKEARLDGEFIWTKKEQSLVLVAYFYGYLIFQIAGGWLAQRTGAKFVLMMSILVGSLSLLTTSWVAHFGYIPLIICRFVMGVVHAAFWPSMFCLWSHWAPPIERSRLVGISSSGAQVGNIIGFSLSSYLAVHSGWSSIFYLYGGLGLVWVIVVLGLFSNTPSEHRFISKEESKYIVEELAKSHATSTQKKATPWKAILVSKSCIVMYVAHFAHAWGSYLFMLQLPSYMQAVLKFDIKSNGLWSAFPYIVLSVLITFSGMICDALIASGKLSKVMARKVFTGLGIFLPMVAVLLLCFVDCNHRVEAIACITLGIASNAFYYGGGLYVNYSDIAGQFSGVLFGISNTIASASGIISPYLVGLLTPTNSREEWRIVFYIFAGVHFVGGLVFCLFAKSQLEPWAKSNDAAANKEKDSVDNMIASFEVHNDKLDPHQVSLSVPSSKPRTSKGDIEAGSIRSSQLDEKKEPLPPYVFEEEKPAQKQHF